MHWIYLILAISFEVMGTLSLKQLSISNNYYWGVAVAIFFIISFTFLGFAVKKIDIGTAYAIWSGFGTATIAILGWLVFKEVMSFQKILAISLIVMGAVILKLQHS